MQKVKRRSPVVYVPVTRNGHGNGHQTSTWIPGDPVENHPLASAMGAFKDDPTWDEFVQIMQDERQKQLERDLKNLEEEEAQSVRAEQ